MTMIPPKLPPINPKDLPKILALLKKGWDVIKNFFSPDKRIKKEKGYDEQKSQAIDVAALHKILGEYRADVKNAGNIILGDIKNECIAFFDKTIDQFARYGKDIGIEYLSSAYKRKFTRLIDEIEESFDFSISKNLSFDNPECYSILKMPAGDLKGDRMTEFKKVVFKEALNDICKKINRIVDEFFDMIDSAFANKLNTMSENAQKCTNLLEELVSDNENSTLKYEEIQLKALKQITISDIAINIIGGDL